MIHLVSTEEVLGRLSCEILHLSLYCFIMPETLLVGKFHKWLNAPDPSTNHNIARKKYHKNTGQWLLDDERYRIWKQQPNSFMWINGICKCCFYIE